MKRHCKHCGALCRSEKVGAETNMQYYGDAQTIPFGSEYDEKTGKRNYCWKITCPNYHPMKWFQMMESRHDSYFINKTVH